MPIQEKNIINIMRYSLARAFIISIILSCSKKNSHQVKIKVDKYSNENYSYVLYELDLETTEIPIYYKERFYFTKIMRLAETTFYKNTKNNLNNTLIQNNLIIIDDILDLILDFVCNKNDTAILLDEKIFFNNSTISQIDNSNIWLGSEKLFDINSYFKSHTALGTGYWYNNFDNLLSLLSTQDNDLGNYQKWEGFCDRKRLGTLKECSKNDLHVHSLPLEYYRGSIIEVKFTKKNKDIRVPVLTFGPYISTESKVKIPYIPDCVLEYNLEIFHFNHKKGETKWVLAPCFYSEDNTLKFKILTIKYHGDFF